MKNNGLSKVIISWFRADDVEGNQARKDTLDAWVDSKGFTPEKVIGYSRKQGQDEGSFENSYSFAGLSNERNLDLLKLAKEFKQDAVLYSDSTGVCYLVDTTKDNLETWKDDMLRLGKWTKVSGEKAVARGAFIIANNDYLIAA